MREVLVVYYEHCGSSAGMHILDRMPENEQELDHIFDEILCIPNVYKQLMVKSSETNFEKMKEVGYWQFRHDVEGDEQVVYFHMKKVIEL